MILIGLTGSIGMGKSTTAAMFREAGVPVYDADAAVHDLYAKGGAAVGPVGEAFPGVVRDGAVDREALRQRVLGNPEALKRLNAIVHPLVGRDRVGFFQAAEAAGADMVVLDIPLLFETGGEANVDAVVVVSAPAEMQRERVLARPGMTPERLDAILAQQMADAEKRARAHFVVDTGRGLEPPAGRSRDHRGHARPGAAARVAGAAKPVEAGRAKRAIEGAWRARSSSTPRPPASNPHRPPAGRARLPGDRGLHPHRAQLPPLYRPLPRHPGRGRAGARPLGRVPDRQAEVRRIPTCATRSSNSSATRRSSRTTPPSTGRSSTGSWRRSAAASCREPAGSTPWRWPSARFPGMHNSLDALCKRFKISLSEREKHGALIDAKLLAAVYLELKGGRERRLELTSAVAVAAVAAASQAAYGVRSRPLAARSTEEERAVHANFVRDVLKSEELWSRFGL